MRSYDDDRMLEQKNQKFRSQLVGFSSVPALDPQKERTDQGARNPFVLAVVSYILKDSFAPVEK